MMAAIINRKQLKSDMKTLVADAQVSPKVMIALYMGIILILNLVVDGLIGDAGLLSTFLSILASLLALVLSSGFSLYCMAIRRGERAEVLTLFDGFSFVGKIIGLNIVMYLFISLWSLLFVVPGIIAAYRYRFAVYNLYENPGIGIMEALDMSKKQTLGYKSQLLMLDLSYFGWGLLAAVPSLIYDSLLSQEVLMNTMAYAGAGPLSAMPAGLVGTAILPIWGWTLIIGLWQLVVSLFYLSTYACVELGYFEIAKSTSGVGAGNSSGQAPWSNGPDNMGGF